jgi:ankyrin repeat protein
MVHSFVLYMQVCSDYILSLFCLHQGDEPRFLAFLIEKSYVRNGAKLLIDLHVPSKDSVGMYPLHWAVIEGTIPLVAMLLQHLEERPSPYQRSSSVPSSFLISQDENDLASDSASVNPSNIGIDAQDLSGCTPLLIASQYGHPDLAAFLIRRGANPHAVDSSRDTALHWAAYKGSVEVCGLLLHLLGVEGQLDSLDAFGQTPLHLASLRGNTDTVMFLMEEAESVGYMSNNPDSTAVVRVGSKITMSNKSPFLYPGKLLVMTDREGKTPKDLAIKKKKLGCEMLLQEYEEKYLLPKRSILSRMGQSCRDLFSMHNWKAWMGMSGADTSNSQSLTFPFYWMTAHILLAGVIYVTEFVGLGSRLSIGENSILLDRIDLHIFFLAFWIATWGNLYGVYKTNPGILDARSVNDSSRSNSGRYPKDKISLEMEAITKELRQQYDAVIDSYSKDFPPQDKRVNLCHSCRIVKPLRSKHCRVTRRCVLLFDHHCPFVGATIGLYNYLYFFLFLIAFCLMAVGFIAAWIIFLIRSNPFPKGAFLMGGYFSLYLIPVGFMACYHANLVLSNISTNEQMNVRKYRYFWDESGRFHNPFNRGISNNISQRCCPDRSSYDLGCFAGEVELTRDGEERQSMVGNMV